MGARVESVIEVPVDAVDSILPDHGVQPRCDLLCIDAQRHEREVFKDLRTLCKTPSSR